MIGRLILVFIVLLMNTVNSSIWPSYKSSSKLGCYRKAAVSTDTVPCTTVGTDILKRNGSAVDAAIAMLVCIGANNPQSSGLGGGFFMLYYNRTEKKTYFIDAREACPIKSDRQAHENGPESIAVPGELAGYEKAYSLFGKLPWKELFKPTIKMCREGIIVSEHLENATNLLVNYSDTEIGKMFLKDGNEGYRKGERIKMPKLARTLEEISKIGKKALYGPSKMARQFIADLKAAGSKIDQTDMQRYRICLRKPLKAKLRNEITLHTASKPGAGAYLAEMLTVLDSYPNLSKHAKKEDKLAALFYHRIVEAIKKAENCKSLTYCKSSTEMRKNSRFNSLRCKNSDTETHRVSYRLSHGHVSTAHLSVLAPDGDAVSVTTSINGYFGSFIMSPSTGIILNNHMADFSSGSTMPNSPQAGKSPRSTMSPSIFTDSKGNVKLVIGAAGGHRIASTIMQIAARVLFFGENIKESIDAPRLHVFYNGLVEFEPDFPEEMRQRLRDYGHTMQHNWIGISIATGIMRTKCGLICANSDYRKDGKVDGLN